MKYLSAVIGVLMTTSCGYALWYVMQAPTVDRHLVYLFFGGGCFGMLLIIPTMIVTSLKSLLGVVGPYLPKVTLGQRSGDSPPPTPTPSTDDKDKDAPK